MEMSKINGSGKFYAVECDVSSEEEVLQALDYVEKNFKQLHVLVNNAGTAIFKKIQGKIILILIIRAKKFIVKGIYVIDIIYL